MAEASELLPDRTMISASGACSLILRITSKPESPPSARSTSATSTALPARAAFTAAIEVAQSTRYPRAFAAVPELRVTGSSLSTINSETGRMVMTAIPRADGAGWRPPPCYRRVAENRLDGGKSRAGAAQAVRPVQRCAKECVCWPFASPGEGSADSVLHPCNTGMFRGRNMRRSSEAHACGRRSDLIARNWKREAGSWKREAGSGKREAGSWKLEAGYVMPYFFIRRHIVVRLICS